MYIGNINISKTEFTRPNGKTFPHTDVVDGKKFWKWSRNNLPGKRLDASSRFFAKNVKMS